MRKAALAFIVLTAAFIAIGWWPVKQNWITKDTYLTTAAIVGGIASVIGLLSLVRSPLSRKDFENVEWESITKIAESEKALTELEGRKVAAHNELERLTRTRQELTDLVKKASAVLFLREELERSSQKLRDFLEKEPELKQDLIEYREKFSRLMQLDEEVEAHPDAELITDVLFRARRISAPNRSEIMNTLDQIPIFGPVLKLLLLIVDSYVRAVKIVVR